MVSTEQAEQLWKGWDSKLLHGRGPSLTRIRLSMTSLQSCRLVALVTSKNKLQVVFLILRIGFQKRRVIGVGPPASLSAELQKAGGAAGGLGFNPALHPPGMVVHTYYPSFREVETRGSQARGNYRPAQGT